MIRWRNGLLLAAASLMLALGGFATNRPAVTHASTSGGVVLDYLGGLHTFGGLSLNTSGAPYWSFPIARSVSVISDGSGGWTLDGYGAIHNWGSAPNVSTCAYWSGWDIARAVVVLPDKNGSYVLDGYGGLHNCGTAPSLSGAPYWGVDIARGLDIHYNGSGVADGGWVLDGYGGLHAFGNAPSIGGPEYFVSYSVGYDTWHAVHITGNGAGGYALAHYGLVQGFGSTGGTSWSGYSDWGSSDVTRDVVLVNQSGSWAAQGLIDRGAEGAFMDGLENWARAWFGKGPLSENGTLDAIAGNGQGANCTPYDRTVDMVVRNYDSHYIPECGGQTVWQVYPYGSFSAAGENIGHDNSTIDYIHDANVILNAWMNSPEHQANILSNSQPFNSTGCGVYWGLTYQGFSYEYVYSCEFAQY